MRRLCVALVASLALACAGPSTATDKNGPMAKVSDELRELYEAYLAAQRSSTVFKPRDPLIPIVDDRVVIDAVASGDVAALRADLVALGMRGTASAGRIVSGQFPISAIGALARLPSLRFARAAMATTRGVEKGRSP